MTIPMKRWSVEADFIALKKRILDPNIGLNFYIARTNTERAAFDVTDYGQIITLNLLALPGQISADDPGALFTMTGNETYKNYNPYILLTLIPSSLSLNEDGPATTAKTKLGLFLGFTAPIDGTADIMAIRYIDVLKYFLNGTRWQDLQPRRFDELEVVDYTPPGDNRSWREVGIAIGSASASQ